MNIQSFGLIDAKYFNPTTGGELTSVPYGCWWFAHVFFDMKFIAMFSMLFCAGIILMWERSKLAERELHYSRMFWLLLLEIAHAHLLWIGDILYSYALCGMIGVLALRFSTTVVDHDRNSSTSDWLWDTCFGRPLDVAMTGSARRRSCKELGSDRIADRK